MSQISLNASASGDTNSVLSKQMLMVLAGGAGLSVASLYYAQPMLGAMAATPMATSGGVGMLPMLTQLGYAAGIFFLAPLGDKYDRRNIIVTKGLLLAVMLLLCGLAPSMWMLFVTSFAIGITATVAQDIVPATATLSPPHSRGKTVGTVMTGLLLGILLSRVVSGIVADYFGWRIMFCLAAVSVLLITFMLRKALPHFAPTTGMGYPSLLLSLLHLWQSHPALRRAVTTQAIISIGFSAFWSTLAVMLSDSFHLGSSVAGAFGLAGAAGALAAPFAGFIADRWGSALVTRGGTALAALSFALLLAMPLLPLPGKLALLAISAIGFDLGVQATLVAHQTIVYGLEPAARSRLNAILFTGMFTGMASGAALGSEVLQHFGWNGVVIAATLSSVVAFVYRYVRP